MTISNLSSGVMGQIQGPISADDTIIFHNDMEAAKFFKIGIFINEKDLMTYNWKFPVIINDQFIIIGKAGMYEPDGMLQLDTIMFPYGAPASVIIDYIVLEA